MKGKIIQIFAAFSVSFAGFLFAVINSWPSYTMKVFESDNSPLSGNLTTTDVSLIGSLPSIGALVITPLGAMMVEKLGKKRVGILTGIIISVSWAIIAVSSNVLLLLIARFLGGMGGGLNMVLAPTFISEISEDSIRGALSSLCVVCFCLGILSSYIMGWVLSYTMIVMINLTMSIMSIGMILLMKETPLYLIIKGDDKEALTSLAFYRGVPGNSKALLEEFSKIKGQINVPREMYSLSITDENGLAEQEKLQSEIEDPVPLKSVTGWRFLCKSPTSRRALLICVLMAGLQVFMGMIAVQVYAGKLFSTAAPNLSPDLCSVLLAIVLLLGSMAAASASDYAGRRVLMLSSTAAVAICMTVLGSLVSRSWGPEWMVPVVILIFCFVFNMGAGTVPYVLLGEYFVPEVKNFGSAVVMSTVWLTNFVILAIFNPGISLFGLDGLCYIFAGFSILTMLTAYFMLPETKGLSCNAIQEMFASKSK